MRDKTISENLALYKVAHEQRLRQIRLELRQAQRRFWWLRFKRLIVRRPSTDGYYVIKL